MKKIYILVGIYIILLVSVTLIHPKIRVAEAKPIAQVDIDQYANCMQFKK